MKIHIEFTHKSYNVIKIDFKRIVLLKKLFLTLVFMVLVLQADVIVSPNALPENIKQFISTHFKAQIGLVEMDKKSYEIYLTDGTELEFDILGNWKEIESKLTPIDFAVLPANISKILQNQFPGAVLVEVKHKINYYKIKLSNRMKIRIDPNGTILSQKFDD